MFGNSREIRTAQTGPHDKLIALVARHREQAYQKPIAPWNLDAFDQAMAKWGGSTPLILDAGCGVGWSSLALAEQFPDHFVMGVDQSEDRLGRGKPQLVPGNLVFARADLVDFWRLLWQHRIRLARHYVLYPNPWPKIGQLARRWHGHAVFPVIPKLGGVFECRSNWRTYIEELAIGFGVLTGTPPSVEDWQPTQALTPFERKYMASGQALYRLCLTLPGEAQ